MAGCALPNGVRPLVSPEIDQREVLAHEGEEIEVEGGVGVEGERHKTFRQIEEPVCGKTNSVKRCFFVKWKIKKKVDNHVCRLYWSSTNRRKLKQFVNA